MNAIGLFDTVVVPVMCTHTVTGCARLEDINNKVALSYGEKAACRKGLPRLPPEERAEADIFRECATPSALPKACRMRKEAASKETEHQETQGRSFPFPLPLSKAFYDTTKQKRVLAQTFLQDRQWCSRATAR